MVIAVNDIGSVHRVSIVKLDTYLVVEIRISYSYPEFDNLCINKCIMRRQIERICMANIFYRTGFLTSNPNCHGAIKSVYLSLSLIVCSLAKSRLRKA